MTYTLPQVLIFQDFTPNIAAPESILYACPVGPHAKLIRHAEATEKAQGRLGTYDSTGPTSYAWPHRDAGALIDNSYVKLFMENALLQYFDDASSSGSVIHKVANFANRVRSASVNFATNGDYLRDASLIDRDVQPGDVARVRATVGDVAYEVCANVQGLVGDAIASTVGAAAADSHNVANQGASTSHSKTSGADNCVSLSAVDGTSYDGRPTGQITETYTLRVIQSSVNGDFTTARLRITSASGRDDVVSATPAGSGVPFDIGTLGLTGTFLYDPSDLCSEDADSVSVSANDLIQGQTWTVTVHQAYTAPTPTSGGTYTGPQDTTYLVTVSRGGAYTDDLQPQISVTTTRGDDISGPTTVTAAATFVPIGTFGATIKFSGTGLALGDVYIVECVAEAAGPMRTLVLSKSLPAEIDTSVDLSVTLYIRKPLLEITKNREGFAPETNFDLSDTEITVNEGIIAYDPTWTDSGVLQALPVVSQCGYGVLYLEVRYWLQDLCGFLNTVSAADIDAAISGPLHPDNPLKYAVFKAGQNSNGAPIKFISVCNPDSLDSWNRALEILAGHIDVYGLVPLTTDPAVLSAFETHVNTLASPENGQWRVAWFTLDDIPEQAIVTSANSEDSELVLATVTDDLLTSGTQYTRLVVPTSNGLFLTNGVQSGDTVRLLYTGDGFGNFTYSEYLVDRVVSEDELLLLSGPDAPINTPSKIEIWRTLSATEEAAALAAVSGAYANRRIRSCWPNTAEGDGYTALPGYFVAAGWAGYRSGVAPHQALTNAELSGFTSMDRTTKKFNRFQLDTMAASGTWITTQSPAGAIYCRQAVTTGDYADVNEREEMVTSNVDEMSQEFRDLYAPFIGQANVTPSLINLLNVETVAKIEQLKASRATAKLGGQLLDGSKITSIGPHATLADRVVIVVAAVVPITLNVIEMHLVV